MSGLIARAVAGVREARAAGQFGDSSILPNSAAGLAGAGAGRITEQGALAISSVMSCVRVLALDVSMMPFGAFRRAENGVPSPVGSEPQIVAEPFGPDVERHFGMAQLMVSLALRGTAYMGVVDETTTGWPTQLQILHPDRVKPQRVNGVKKYRVNGDLRGTDEVKQISLLGLPGSDVGLDPITYYQVTLQAAGDVQAFSGSFFRNGATPSGLLKVPGAGNKAKAREVKEQWEAGHTGLANAHRIAVMFGGVQFEPLSVTPEQAQFLQTRAFLREDVAGMFGVPLHRIMAIVDKASQGGGKGLDSQDQGYVTHTLLPYLLAIEACWARMIPGGRSTFARFGTDVVLRADALTRAQIAQIHRLTGIRNRDEIRAEEGLPPIGGPDGEDYNIPFNTNSRNPYLLEEGLTPFGQGDDNNGSGTGDAK